MSQDILVKVGADVSDFSKEMTKASSTLKDFGKRNAETFDAFKKVGAGFMGVSATLTGGLGLAVKSSADFERQMSRVKAISGATADEMDELSKSAQHWGATTAFTSVEAGQAQEFMAQAGWKANEILDATGGLLSLAAAGGLELGGAAQIVTGSLNAFGLKAEFAAEASDILAYTSGNSGANVEQLGESLSYSATAMSEANMSYAEGVAALGLLADNQIVGSRAGTVMNAVLRDIRKSAEDGAIAIGETAVAVYDSDGAFRPFADILSDVEKATAGMTDAQRDAALGQVFQQQSLQGMSILLKEGSDSYRSFTDELNNSTGAAETMREEMENNLYGQLQILMSGITQLAMDIGDVLVPHIQKAIEVVQRVTDWFSNLSETTKGNIAIFAAVTAVLTGIAGAGLLIVGFIPAILSGFAALGTVLAAIFSPVTLIIAGIIALGAALVYAYNEVEWFRDLVNEAWAWISDAFSEALEFIKDIAMTVFSEVSEFIGEQLAKIKVFWDKYGAEIIDLVVFYFDAIWEYIKFTIEWIKSIFQIIWPIISGVVKIAWNYIKMWVENGIDFVLGVIQTILKILKGDWSGAWESIKDTARNIMNNIKKFFKNIDLLQIGKDIIKGLINGIKSMGSSIKNAVSNLAGKLPGWIKKPLGIKSPSRVFMEIGDWLGVGLAEGITDTTGLVEKATGKLTAAAQPDVSAIDMSYATPSGIRTTLASAVSGTVDVNSRDVMIAGAIDMLGRKLDGLTVEMDGIKVGVLTAPTVGREIQADVEKRMRGGGRRRIR